MDLNYCPNCGDKIDSVDTLSNSCQNCGEILRNSSEFKLHDKEPIDSIQYAGFWIRFVAHLIDTIILIIPAMFLLTFFDMAGLLIYVLLVWIYYAFHNPHPIHNSYLIIFSFNNVPTSTTIVQFQD